MFCINPTGKWGLTWPCLGNGSQHDIMANSRMRIIVVALRSIDQKRDESLTNKGFKQRGSDCIGRIIALD